MSDVPKIPDTLLPAISAIILPWAESLIDKAVAEQAEYHRHDNHRNSRVIDARNKRIQELMAKIVDTARLREELAEVRQNYDALLMTHQGLLRVIREAEEARRANGSEP